MQLSVRGAALVPPFAPKTKESHCDGTCIRRRAPGWIGSTCDVGKSRALRLAVTVITASLANACHAQVEVIGMIRLKEDTRAQLMMAHGFAMLALGLGLFYIRGTMTNSFFDVIASAFAMLLVTGSLLFIAAVDWICAVGLGFPQVFKLRGLLFLSAGAGAGAVFLILYPGSTIGMFCYLIAIYALLLSIGKFSLAMYWKGTKGVHAVMYVLAALAFFFSALLAMAARRMEREAIAVIGGYAVFIGLQMLLSMYYLEQQRLKQLETAPGSKPGTCVRDHAHSVL